jgi:uncharacterized membrane protein YkoI
MKIRTLALAIVGLSSASAFAVAMPAAEHPLKLADVVTQLESRYPGNVVAIELDASGDKRAHYHVDMQFPHHGLARVDVDAKTLEVVAREPAAQGANTATLAEVVTLVAANVPGELTAIELDAADGVSPHYDVDVRLPQRQVARLKVDVTSRAIAWRTPAIVAE